MLKMFIDNEEVVSNKDFTIKEEMLNASSTILNNTYPKSWEQDKDYTSRFYYPKDYAKLNIQNHTLVQQAEAGTTIQVNEAATINDVNASKNSKVTKLLGQTSQTTIDGRNLLDGAHPTDYNVATTTFTNDIIKVSSTNTTTLPQARFQIDNLASNDVVRYSTIIQSSNGMVVGQAYSNGTWTSLGSMTSYYTNGTSPSTASWTNTSGYTKFRLTLYSSKTIPTGNSESSYKETIVTINNSDLTYVPYVGGVQSPNPSYPQPVNVVSGDNSIEVCGKNLFNVNSGLHYATNASGVTSNYVHSNSTDYIPCVGGSSYTISGTAITTGDYNFRVVFFDENKGFISRPVAQLGTVGERKGYTATAPNNAKYVMAQFYDNITDGQFEKASSMTNYEPYVGTSYPIYLGVENLYGGFTYSRSTNGIDFTHNEDGTISVNGTASADAYSMTSTIGSQHLVSLQAGTYTLSGSITGTDLQVLKGDGTSIANTTGATPITFTLNATTSVFVRLKVNNGTQIINKTIYAQLEKGSKANHFTPYGTTPIELCKIGDYQDYIYKEDGSWYLHKEIGKVVLDGSETGWGNDGGGAPYKYSMSDIKNPPNNQVAEVFCNFYTSVSYGDNWNNYDYLITRPPYNTTSKGIKFKNKDISSLNDFKTWLNTHNTIVYYVLETPTINPITDETLISQLDALESS